MLQVNDYHGLLPKADTRRSLESGRLTIGRGPENDWILPDPERVISKQHCVIEAVGGGYDLTDTSSNGAYVNSKDRPVGRGQSVALKDGDRILISHFEIQVSLAAGQGAGTSDLEAEAPAAAPYKAEDDLDALFGRASPAGNPADDALDAMLAGGTAGQDDPFGETPSGLIPDDGFSLTEDAGPDTDDDLLAGPRTEQIPASEELVALPEAAADAPTDAQIPEDWFLEESSEGAAIPDDPFADEPAPPAAPPRAEKAPAAPARRSAAAQSPAPPPAPAAAAPPPVAAQSPAPAPAAASRAGSDAAALRAFLAGAGLDNLDIPDDKAQEVLENLGQIYREVVKGLMEVLAARSSIKNEFRLSQTMIQPVENNPLKFSLSADDAMAALLTKSGRGYLPPLRAVEEAFEDIKAHQVAVLAGMQQALSGLLDRFDPKSLEQRIEGDKGIGKLLGGKKARYWDAFSGLYEKISSEAEDDFQSIFGRAFGKAYEEQVRKHGRRGG